MLSPLVMLELINRRHLSEDFPLVLFGWLWLLPAAFWFVLTSRTSVTSPVWYRLLWLVAWFFLLGAISLLWIATIIDQMPCFIGVPLCD